MRKKLSDAADRSLPQSRDELAPYKPVRRHRPVTVVNAVHFVRRVRTPMLWAYSPRSTLVLPDNTPRQAAVPAIDFHAHLGRWLSPSGDWLVPDVPQLLTAMDALNITHIVNLDGRWGSELEANLERYDRAHPCRFSTFCHVDWRLLEEQGGPERLVASLARSVAAGARGLKVWKDLGLAVTVRGERVMPDDRRLEPLWDAAGAAGIPVLIHVADPVAFFLPANRHNERLEELRRYPHARHQGGLPEHRQLLDSLERLVSAHPATTFVSAHACHPEDLGHVGALLSRCPNLYIDVAASINLLGRQPRMTRALLERHSDRVLFGTDNVPFRPDVEQTYFRFLETSDEAFPHSPDSRPLFGRWAIYGLGLPRDVLERVYRANALRLLAPPPPPPAPEHDQVSPLAPRLHQPHVVVQGTNSPPRTTTSPRSTVGLFEGCTPG